MGHSAMAAANAALGSLEMDLYDLQGFQVWELGAKEQALFPSLRQSAGHRVLTTSSESGSRNFIPNCPKMQGSILTVCMEYLIQLYHWLPLSVQPTKF